MINSRGEVGAFEALSRALLLEPQVQAAVVLNRAHGNPTKGAIATWILNREGRIQTLRFQSVLDSLAAKFSPGRPEVLPRGRQRRPRFGFQIKLRKNFDIRNRRLIVKFPQSDFGKRSLAVVCLISGEKGKLSCAGNEAIRRYLGGIDQLLERISEKNDTRLAAAARDLETLQAKDGSAKERNFAQIIGESMQADCIIWENVPGRMGLRTLCSTIELQTDLPAGMGLATWASSVDSVLVIPDLSYFEIPRRKLKFRPVHPMLIKEHRWRSGVYLPLGTDSNKLGSIALLFKDYRIIPDEDLSRARILSNLVSAHLQISSDQSLENYKGDRMKILAQVVHAGLTAKTIIHNMPTYLDGTSALIERALQASSIDSHSYEVLHLALDRISDCQSMCATVLNIASLQNPNLIPMELAPIIRAAVDEHEPEALDSGVDLNFVNSTDTLKANCDPVLLKQAVYCLLENAIQHTRHGKRKLIGAVDVTVFSEGLHTAVIEIRDLGDGMDASVLQHIREPLFTTRLDGTGLGVTMAARIVEDVHGGSLTFTSEKGKGTSVRIVLEQL